jgi:ubiquinone/menaquinone biosynthesis C-methylase UbiE
MFTEKDRNKCEQLLTKYYKGRKFRATLYRETIRNYLREGDRVLDAGCGRYLEFSRELPGSVQAVGVDLETELDTQNQRSPYGIRGDLSNLPLPSNYFDLVVSTSVIEHLADPPQVFREFHRVLKNGGKVILSTPNKYDYVSIIASLTPYRWHRKLVSKIVGVNEDDVFPTLYRANSRSALARALHSAGFVEREMHSINHYPVYLMFSSVAFRLGVLYERLTSLRGFESLRGTLLCVYEKRAADDAPAEDGRRREEHRQQLVADA